MVPSDPRPIFRTLPSSRPGTRAAHLRLLDIVQSLKFLVAGGIATAINWAARFPLSLVVPFDAAVALAYGIGMIAGFVLYRSWVFKGSTLLLHHQLWRFLAVNGVGLAVVLPGSSLALSALDSAGVLSPGWRPAVAHAGALTLGAVVNFLGHRSVTFARRSRSAAGGDTRARLNAGRSSRP